MPMGTYTINATYVESTNAISHSITTCVFVQLVNTNRNAINECIAKCEDKGQTEKGESFQLYL